MPLADLGEWRVYYEERDFGVVHFASPHVACCIIPIGAANIARAIIGAYCETTASSHR